MTPPLEYLFINTELTVHLFRLPVGEWVCLDAVSRIDPSGVGVAESILWDEVGRLGRGNQALLVAPRELEPAPSASRAIRSCSTRCAVG